MSALEPRPARFPRPRHGLSAVLVAAGLTAGLAGAVGFAPAPAPTHPAARAAAPRITPAGRRLAQLPIRFEANRGQTNSQAQFLARSRGSVLFLTARGTVIKTRAGAVAMTYRGARAVADPQGLDPLPGSVHYLLGRHDYSVPSFAKIRYAGIYPGVDALYYGRRGHLEYDLRLAPHAHAARIRMSFAGAVPAIESDGSLKLNPDVSLQQPVAYQTIGGERRSVSVRYTVASDHTVGFALGRYNPDYAVVIDPVLSYSTYLGGTSQNSVTGVATDAAGDTFVTGYTMSSDFPMAASGTPYQGAKVPDDNNDAFVTEIGPNGQSLIYSTYLGGNQDDRAAGIAIDGKGDAFVVGYTSSTDFPTTSGAFQTASGNTADAAFMSELSPDGSKLLYSTYLSGNSTDKATSVAVYTPSSGPADVFVAGYTTSPNFPVTGGAPQTTYPGQTSGFVTVLNPTAGATNPVYSTYVGGTDGITNVNAIAVDASGNAYIAGTTAATKGLPITSGAMQPANAGGYDAFAGELDRTGLFYDYLTYFGGSLGDGANGIAVDAAGNAFLTGNTDSTNLFGTNRTTLGSGTLDASQDAFVLELNQRGLYAGGGFLGGSASDNGTAIAVDGSDNTYIVGSTSSTDFNGFSGFASFQPNSGGVGDAFLAKVNGNLTSVIYFTYLGGTSNDSATGVALDANGDIVISGNTNSPNFPVTKGAVQAAQNSQNDGFVTKFVAAAQGSFNVSTLGFPSQATGVASTPATAILTSSGEKPLTITDIKVTGPFSISTSTTTPSSGTTNVIPACTVPSTLQPQSQCAINVVFTPTAASASTGTVVISDNSPAGQEVLPLQGSGGDFSLAISPTGNTISAGTSASYALEISPAAGYTGIVALTCTGNPLPANTTCVASPTSLTQNGSTPSTATYTVTTTIRPSMVPPGPSIPPGPWTWLALFGLGTGILGAIYALLHRGRRRRRLGWAGVAVLLGWAAVSVACGGSTTNPGTPAGNYTLTFTGTDGNNVSHSVTATLTVN